MRSERLYKGRARTAVLKVKRGYYVRRGEASTGVDRVQAVCFVVRMAIL